MRILAMLALLCLPFQVHSPLSLACPCPSRGMSCAALVGFPALWLLVTFTELEAVTGDWRGEGHEVDLFIPPGIFLPLG